MSRRDDYFGDVCYEVWCRGGNPDRVDRDRCRDAEDSGREADEYAASLMRRAAEREEERRAEEEYREHERWLAEQDAEEPAPDSAGQ